jgi:hypothetical protein
MSSQQRIPLLWCACSIGAPMAVAAAASANQHVVVTLMPAGKISAPAAVTLTNTSSFGSYSGTVQLQYNARTSPGSTGGINMQAASDFSPPGGPAIARGALTYNCGAATLGSACTGVQTLSLSAAAPVVSLPAAACTGGGGQCSSTDPNTVSLTFFLDDDPVLPTGGYRAQITFIYSNP